MNKFFALTVLFTATVAVTQVNFISNHAFSFQAFSTAELESMQLKAILDSQHYTHQNHKRLNQATGIAEESPELKLAENFLKGVLEGFSY